VDAEHFAGRLRELREAAGWTQQELAERAGLTRDGIAQLERGRRQPVWETVIALCGALDVSSEEFRKKPGELPPLRPGRPRKGIVEPTSGPAPKQPRKKQ